MHWVTVCHLKVRSLYGNMRLLLSQIKSAKTVVLSTHRNADGDGLGAQIALFHALQACGKAVRILNVNGTPKRYAFLNTEQLIEDFESSHCSLEPTDLAIICDTNDTQLLGELYPVLERQCQEIAFIDHHPLLEKGVRPGPSSYIDIKAASTGEMVYALIESLGVSLNAEIARALYASIVFDTQLFRYVRGSATSHRIAAHLLEIEKEPERIHQWLFGNHSIKKMGFLSRTLGRVESFEQDTVAMLKITQKDLDDFDLHVDESKDIIDMLMNVATLKVAVLFQEGKGGHRVSFRCKAGLDVRKIAESLGGGGHVCAAGAWVKAPLLST